MAERIAVSTLVVLVLGDWQRRRVCGAASAKPFTCEKSTGRKLLLLLYRIENADIGSACDRICVQFIIDGRIRSEEPVDFEINRPNRWAYANLSKRFHDTCPSCYSTLS
jgi:hypothetical protein